MSTPSPEAKQAAEEWERKNRARIPFYAGRIQKDSFAYGYDAAMAKSETRCGELREELEQKDKELQLRSSEYEVLAGVIGKQRQQLAHQQPSHQCQHFYGTHTDRQCARPATTGEYCQEHAEAHQPPSPASDGLAGADVDKIAQNTAHNIDTRLPYGFTNDETDIVEDEVRAALAQVEELLRRPREPLVKAREVMCLLVADQRIPIGVRAEYSEKMKQVGLAPAALTGTGE